MWNLKEREAISTKYERGERFQVLHDKDDDEHYGDKDGDKHYSNRDGDEHCSDKDNYGGLSENLGGSAGLPEHRGD